jgi:excisionase family DNA binding protein
MNENTTWLTLGEAAEQLGVHANTLRRWADEGRLSFMLTLGGHRRFALQHIEELLAEQQQSPDSARVGELWIAATLEQMRTGLSTRGDARWVAEFDSGDRTHKRVLGRRMMELVQLFVTRNDGDEMVLAEARSMGRAYAESAMTAELPVTAALSAILFFRDALTLSIFDLPDGLHIPSAEQKRLLGRMTDLLDQVELAIVETYEDGGATASQTKPG